MRTLFQISGFRFQIYTVGLLIIMLSISSCGRKEEPKAEEPAMEEPEEPPSKESIGQKVLSFNLEGLSDKGTKKWDVTGESAEAITEDQVKLNNITAKTYGQDGQATITAKKGLYDKSKNNVRLEEDVKATIENTEKFADEFATIPVGSSASSGGDIGTGSDNQVPGKAGEEKGGDKDIKKTTTVITCDGDVEFDYEKNVASFSKNVKVRSNEGDIDADKITAYMDKDTKKLKSIVAEGSVKMTRGGNITYSDKASYTESEKKVVLSGQPKLVIEKEGDIANNLAADLSGKE